MKMRLLKETDSCYYVLYADGSMETVNPANPDTLYAMEDILNCYANPLILHSRSTATWGSPETDKMEDWGSAFEELAHVTDADDATGSVHLLVLKSPEPITRYFEIGVTEKPSDLIDYLSIAEYTKHIAEKYNIIVTPSAVRTRIDRRQLPGARRIDGIWQIPSVEPWPMDGRRNRVSKQMEGK